MKFTQSASHCVVLWVYEPSFSPFSPRVACWQGNSWWRFGWSPLSDPIVATVWDPVRRDTLLPTWTRPSTLRLRTHVNTGASAGGRWGHSKLKTCTRWNWLVIMCTLRNPYSPDPVIPDTALFRTPVPVTLRYLDIPLSGQHIFRTTRYQDTPFSGHHIFWTPRYPDTLSSTWFLFGTSVGIPDDIIMYVLMICLLGNTVSLWF